MVTPERGGWWHEYVCPVHHTELLPATGAGGDRLYPCQHGCELTGEPYTSAWVALEHQRNARALGSLPPNEALDVLGTYAELYTRLGDGWHEGAKPWMLAGRLFHQALSEAIWTTNVAAVVSDLAGRLAGSNAARLNKSAVPLLRGLLDTMVSARHVLVDDRGELRSNFTAWLNAAGATASGALAALGEVVADHGWIDGPAGLHAHVRAAVLDDGWEWEGSTYYHTFVLLAYLKSLRGTDAASLPPDVAAAVTSMVDVLDAISLPGGALPALHDSPYHGPAGEGRLDAEHRRFETLEYDEAVALGHQFTDAVSGERGMSAHRSPRSRVFADAGYAVLCPPRGDWMAVVDFGPHGGSHGHLDKLALYLYGSGVSWQPDYGIVPYASGLRDLYRSTQVHPAFSVDGADQRECAGRLLEWTVDGDRVIARFGCDGAYEGVTAVRHLELDDDSLLDVVHVRAETERDLRVHFRPDVDLTVRVVAGGWRSDWGSSVPLAAAHACSTQTRMDVVPGWGPADDPQRHGTWLDWTARAEVATFVTRWRPGAGPDVPVEVHTLDLGFDSLDVGTQDTQFAGRDSGHPDS